MPVRGAAITREELGDASDGWPASLREFGPFNVDAGREVLPGMREAGNAVGLEALTGLDWVEVLRCLEDEALGPLMPAEEVANGDVHACLRCLTSGVSGERSESAARRG